MTTVELSGDSSSTRRRQGLDCSRHGPGLIILVSYCLLRGLKRHLQYWNSIPSRVDKSSVWTDRYRYGVGGLLSIPIILATACIVVFSISARVVFKKWILRYSGTFHCAAVIKSFEGIGSTNETSGIVPRPCLTPLRELSSFQINRKRYSQGRLSVRHRMQWGLSSIEHRTQQVLDALWVIIYGNNIPEQRSRRSLQETHP